MDSSGQKKDTYQAEDKNIVGFGNLLDLDGGETTPTHQEVHSNVSTAGSGIDELLSLGQSAPVHKPASDPLAELMGMS